MQVLHWGWEIKLPKHVAGRRDNVNLSSHCAAPLQIDIAIFSGYGGAQPNEGCRTRRQCRRTANGGTRHPRLPWHPAPLDHLSTCIKDFCDWLARPLSPRPGPDSGHQVLPGWKDREVECDEAGGVKRR